MKEECKWCKYWTLNDNHGSMPCYHGDCPAKEKDDKELLLIYPKAHIRFKSKLVTT